MDLTPENLVVKIEDVELEFEPVMGTSRFDLVDLAQLSPREQNQRIFGRLLSVKNLTLSGEAVTVEMVQKGLIPDKFLQQATAAYLRGVVEAMGLDIEVDEKNELQPTEEA